MKKFKSKKSKKIKFKTYFLMIIISFIFSIFIFNRTYDENIIFYTLNFITGNINETLNRIFSGFAKPENIIYASLNKNITKDDLSVFKENDDNYNYENNNTSYVEDPSPIKVNKPTVYIYNTHQLEEYSSDLINDYNVRPNVLMASYILKENLNNNKIPTIVETANIKKYLDNNNLKYKYSYKASRHFIKQAVIKNKSLDFFIDIHRDSAKKETTTFTKDNKSYAKIMFIVGLDHKNYKKNLVLAESLNNNLMIKLPGISRGIVKKSGPKVNGIYNQDIHPNTILVEIGGIDNNIEQVYNTMEILATVISEYLRS